MKFTKMLKVLSLLNDQEKQKIQRKNVYQKFNWLSFKLKTKILSLLVSEQQGNN